MIHNGWYVRWWRTSKRLHFEFEVQDNGTPQIRFAIEPWWISSPPIGPVTGFSKVQKLLGSRRAKEASGRNCLDTPALPSSYRFIIHSHRKVLSHCNSWS